MGVSIKYTLIVTIFSIILIANYKCNGQLKPREDRNWRDPDIVLGKISGISISKSKELYIFHRANRLGYPTNEGTIPNDTIAVINTSNRKLIKSWGSNTFVLPHGITVDHNNNVWVTDIGRHQVMRFNNNSLVPNLIIGEELISGNDSNHFCKPTEIAVSSSDVVFVSDGYCNSRIITFSYNGTFLREFPINNGNLIHSLTLIENRDTVCAADRENFRILCYYAGIKSPNRFGELKFIIEDLGQVLAIDYIDSRTLLAVIGIKGKYIQRGISIDVRTRKVRNEWGPLNNNGRFQLPHSFKTSPDKRSLYVGELFPNATQRIYRFNI